MPTLQQILEAPDAQESFRWHTPDAEDPFEYITARIISSASLNARVEYAWTYRRAYNSAGVWGGWNCQGELPGVVLEGVL
jgi:hypothetical protein